MSMLGVPSRISSIGLFQALAPKDPAAWLARDVAYGADPRLRLDAYGPRKPARDLPVVVFFYGGGWDSGRRQDYGWVGRALAAQGFVAIVADYRVYPQVVFPDFLDDGAHAVRWAVDHVAGIGGDPDRIALVGHSAGAYNAVMLGLDPSYLRAAGVDRDHVRAIAGLAGPYDFLPLDGAISTRTFAAAPNLAATQPVNFVDARAPAAFLATGLSDTVVLPRNTAALARALRAKGMAVEERTYANVSHAGLVLALSRPMRRAAPVLADLSRFLRAALAPTSPTPGDRH